MNHNNSLSLDEEIREGLQELEALVPRIPNTTEELNFHLMMVEIVDQIQGTCPIIHQSAALRKIIAQYGDAYFFYDQAGEFCLLTDFSLKDKF